MVKDEKLQEVVQLVQHIAKNLKDTADSIDKLSYKLADILTVVSIQAHKTKPSTEDTNS